MKGMEFAVARDAQEDHHIGSLHARDRVQDAHQLRLTGKDWKTIAAETGYKSGRIAALAVNAWLEKVDVELGPDHRQEALQLELARLDRLQCRFWQLALAGDCKAADIVLKVSVRRSKLLGLDGRGDDVLDAPRTVVVGGTTEEYISNLRALSAGEV